MSNSTRIGSVFVSAQIARTSSSDEDQELRPQEVGVQEKSNFSRASNSTIEIRDQNLSQPIGQRTFEYIPFIYKEERLKDSDKFNYNPFRFGLLDS